MLCPTCEFKVSTLDIGCGLFRTSCFLIHCFFWDSDVSQDEAEKLGFEKVSEEFISECKSKATLFKHKKTGCEVMSVSNEDENKVFGIVLRTPP